MSAAVAAEHTATSEINLGNQDLAPMHALHWEIHDPKWRQKKNLDSSFVAANPEHTRSPCRTRGYDTVGQEYKYL